MISQGVDEGGNFINTSAQMLHTNKRKSVNGKGETLVKNIKTAYNIFGGAVETNTDKKWS